MTPAHHTFKSEPLSTTTAYFIEADPTLTTRRRHEPCL